ncbi:hypothetical protein JTE90_020810 [Oedothorax gibbosus]|uniref:Uncharacterized protein n=1 Tax=Oedothorax gibbosus TaxID=931172 RepID=A0AAV6U6A0_9ARAC|nr:hypothetical protein JTE90_020810 [Oedothorax gibbosus]
MDLLLSMSGGLLSDDVLLMANESPSAAEDSWQYREPLSYEQTTFSYHAYNYCHHYRKNAQDVYAHIILYCNIRHLSSKSGGTWSDDVLLMSSD